MSDDLSDWGPAIQAAAEAHLQQVWEAFYTQDDADNDGVDIEVPTPAVDLFCGCETCVVRETIAGAWPVIEQYFALGSRLIVAEDVA